MYYPGRWWDARTYDAWVVNCVARLRCNEKRQCFIYILLDVPCYTFQFSMVFYGKVVFIKHWHGWNGNVLPIQQPVFYAQFQFICRLYSEKQLLSFNIFVVPNRLVYLQNKCRRLMKMLAQLFSDAEIVNWFKQTQQHRIMKGKELSIIRWTKNEFHILGNALRVESIQ